MVGYKTKDGGVYRRGGIEDYIPQSQYGEEHREKVVKDILRNWVRLSRDGKFHALLATNSIIEAIEYYRLLKDNPLDLKVTALFDKNLDYTGETIFKQDGLVEIIEDYNDMFDQYFPYQNKHNLKRILL